jgi:hypothetical protein
MTWFKRNPPKHSEEIRVPRCEFLGEQDGPSERLLKEKLADFFGRDRSVSRAYLVRVAFGEGKNVSVVLGLRTQFGPDKGMVEKVGAIFASVFNAKEHLDIMFLTDGQETQLVKVCRPFFG